VVALPKFLEVGYVPIVTRQAAKDNEPGLQADFEDAQLVQDHLARRY
jgi:hypothetical protein